MANIELNIGLASTGFDNHQVNNGSYIIVLKNPHHEHNIRSLSEGTTTKFRDVICNSLTISKFEPKNVKDTLTHKLWSNAWDEEPGLFKRKNMWNLAPKPEDKNGIGTSGFA